MKRWKIQKFTYKYGSFHKVPNEKALDKLEREMDVLEVLQRNGDSFFKSYSKWLETREYNRT